MRDGVLDGWLLGLLGLAGPTVGGGFAIIVRLMVEEMSISMRMKNR